MKNKVCMLTTAHEALDIRIFYKECKSLVYAGYQVYLIANCEKDEVVDGINIISLDPGGGRAYRFLVKGFAALFKGIKLNADIYHFHDPDLILAGLILKLLGKKVIYDVHEDVPKDILSKEWIGGLRIRRFVSFIFGILVKFAGLLFDRIIAATPSIAKEFPDHKTIVLRNVPNLAMIDRIKPEDVAKVRPSIIYAGCLTKIRGISQIIEAVEKLDSMAELWLLGRWEDSDYERKCKHLRGWKHVKYFGERSLEQTYAIMKRADMGIVNFLPVPNSVESLPNKAFEYLTCGLPLIMSNFAYWRELFASCAVFADPADPANIAENIKNMVQNRKLRMKLIREGTRLITNEYSWESESEKLIELYKRLDGGRSRETNNGTGEQASIH